MRRHNRRLAIGAETHHPHRTNLLGNDVVGRSIDDHSSVGGNSIAAINRRRCENIL